MKINWVGYYNQNNGYGRVSSHMVRALQEIGIEVKALTIDDLHKPKWMLDQIGVDLTNPTITCTDLIALPDYPGLLKDHWLLIMCESDKVSSGKIGKIRRSGVTQVITPSEYCAQAFRDSGLKLPITVVPLGTNPVEFPLASSGSRSSYTFLTLADRGWRKGWMEVYDAFFKAFGGKTTGIQDVRLVIKSLDPGNPLTNLITKRGSDLDKRIIYDTTNYPDITKLYSKVDCVVLPSRSEGWGMPHREAAMMGLPVITQKYSGMDDGHTDEWAILVDKGYMRPAVDSRRRSSGNWRVVDIHELADKMLWCYDHQVEADMIGLNARRWLMANQTWRDSALRVLKMLESEYQIGSSNVLHMDKSAVQSLASNGRRTRTSDALFGQESRVPAS